MRILLVDDEKMEQLQISFKQGGHTVEHVRDESSAYKLIDSKEIDGFDLAVLDLSMKPPMELNVTGREALSAGKRVYARLRKARPNLRIVIYSHVLDLVNVDDETSHPLTRAFDKNDLDGHELEEYIKRW